MKHLIIGVILLCIPISLEAKHPYFQLDDQVWETKANEKITGQFLRSSKSHVLLLQEDFHVAKIPIRDLNNTGKQRLELYSPYTAEVAQKDASSSLSESLWVLAEFMGMGLLILLGLLVLLKRELFITKLKY